VKLPLVSSRARTYMVARGRTTRNAWGDLARANRSVRSDRDPEGWPRRSPDSAKTLPEPSVVTRRCRSRRKKEAPPARTARGQARGSGPPR